jgi:uncharacterized membrane protein YhaH (DUF805 family)
VLPGPLWYRSLAQLALNRGNKMGFGQAISAGFSNYVNFRDRACRSEYWYWILFIIIAHIVVGIIDSVLGIQLVTGLFGLVTIIPNIAIAVRRLHDLDRTGWWILLGFIPLIGTIILLISYTTKGTDGPNRFGPDPFSRESIPESAIRRSSLGQGVLPGWLVRRSGARAVVPAAWRRLQSNE